MMRALTSAVVSVAMITSSVSAIAADTGTNTKSTPVAQTGPLSPGGPVSVSPAQGEINDLLCPGGDCTPVLVVLGVAGMGVAIAAIMGAFAQNNITSTASTTNTR